MITLYIIGVAIYFNYLAYVFFGLFRHTIKHEKKEEKKKVSVVIAAKNEEEYLPALLNDLVNQDYPKDKLEIIVANDRSSDNTGAIVEKMMQIHNNIKHIKIDSNSTVSPKKFALEEGIRKSEGELILSTDADCRLLKTWVSSMSSSLSEKGGITIGFSRVLAKSFFDNYQLIDFFCIFIANTGFAGWNEYFSGSGQNLAYDKKSFFDIGGFTGTEESISADDMFLVQSISSIKDCQINLRPESYVFTLPEKNILSFINQRIRWSSYSKYNLVKNPKFFLFLLSAFLCNVIILVFSFIKPNISLTIFLIKIFLEGIIIIKGSRLFRTKISGFSFIIWSVLQPIYIPFIGIAGLGKFYKWK